MVEISTVFPTPCQPLRRCEVNTTRHTDILAINPNPLRGRALQRLARKGLLAKLKHLAEGQLRIIEGDLIWQCGSVTSDFPVPVELEVLNPAFYGEVAFGGTVGAGEAYMQGYWRCNNLTDLVRMMARNRSVMDSMEGGMGRLLEPLNKLFHRWHRNSLAGSRRNIEAHYDLGNDFFAQFLDPTMMYSCGVFDASDSSMEAASLAKLDRICRKLELTSSDHVLEIGTGWGGFAIHAARNYGCRVTTTTISESQYELARQRVADAGLSDRITLLKKDFRELEGEFDKLVSIEMIEAVGERNLGVFFEACHQRLRPNGKMLLQAITIADELYDSYRKSVDFIQRHIFPGGFLPCVSALSRLIAERSDLRLFHLEDIGPHYAITLHRWRQRFFANLGNIKALGYPAEFIRMWEYYFCYCEGGFIERSLGTVQMLLVRPRDRSAPLLRI